MRLSQTPTTPTEEKPKASSWKDGRGVYINRDTGKPYTPHHELERRFVYEDGPWTWGLAKGGEGGGKSVAGCVKTCERLRRGMSGIMVSPDFEHFKKSLWPEFARWCPWQHVIAEQRYRGRKGWEPTRPFTLTFDTGAELLCGGIETPESWEGPNVSFFHFDEARKHKDAKALKVLTGRARIPGPNGEPPQGYLTTTPRKHWLYEYFGPLQDDDEFAAFKASSFVIDLLTVDNSPNLATGFVEQRRQSLTEAEARVLLEAQWEDIDDVDRFLPSITWWDMCQEQLPPISRNDALVVAIDAGVSNDNFGMVAVSRHPTRRADVAVRYARAWIPRKGTPLDFAEIEREINAFCEESGYYVVELAYDSYQLHQMASSIRAKGRVMVREFPQGADRLEADKQLLDLITQRRIAHNGEPLLREHIDNADRKTDGDTRKLRIVKRVESRKIDLAVCASMASYRCLKLPL